jgi:hypothetical protein
VSRGGQDAREPQARMPALLLLTEISQILKTVNAGFVAVAPAKVQSVTTDDIKIADLEFV